MKILRLLSCTVAAALLSASAVQATPYASGVTNASGNGTKGGTIHFILNEPADNVYVLFGDGTSNAIASPGTTGVKSFALGSETSFAIYCVKAGSGAVTQISSDANTLNHLSSERGVTVSQNPQNWRFGRTYMSDGVGVGIFCRNADQSDVFGQGQTTGRKAGLPFVASSYSPYRMFVGPDGTLYIGNCSSLAGGSFLGETDGDVLTGGLALVGTNWSYAAGENHTSLVGTPVVTGSIGAGNLVIYCFDVNYPYNGNSGNNLLQWNVGAGPFPSSVLPTSDGEQGLGGLGQIISDNAVTSNYFYLLEERSSPTLHDTPSLMIFSNPNTSGTAVWDSINNTILPGYDLLTNSIGLAVSPDGQYLATMNANGVAYLLKLNNGLPDETTLQQLPGSLGSSASAYGSVAWDAADNLYSVNQFVGLLRVYTLGLTTTCVTSNDYTGVNGSFQFSPPSAAASVVATTPQAYQANNSYANNGATPTPAVFTISLNAASGSDLRQFHSHRHRDQRSKL